MKTIFIAFLSLISFTTIAQKTSVYGYEFSEIENWVKKFPDSISILNKKLIETEDTFTDKQLIFYYYGSAYTENYSPYAGTVAFTLYDSLYKKQKFDECLKIAIDFLNENPGNLKSIKYATIAAKKSNNASLFNRYKKRYLDLAGVPYYSGDGSGFLDARVVTSVSDEYIILNDLDLNFLKQSLIYNEGIPFDVMECKDEKGIVSNHYFDVRILFDSMSKMFNED